MVADQPRRVPRGLPFPVGVLLLLGMFLPIPARFVVQAADMPGLPPVRVFTDRDGLPQNMILAMAADRNGYLWAGTKDGAVVYNGATWTTIAMPNRTASNYVTSLTHAADGTVWFGTLGGGIHALRDGRWRSYDTTTGLPSNDVRSVLAGVSETGVPTLRACVGNSVLEFSNGQWKPLDPTFVPDGYPALLAETRPPGKKPILWIISTGAVLYRIEGGTRRAFRPGIALEILVPTADGGVWTGSPAGILRYGDGDGERIVPPIHREAWAVRALCTGKSPSGGDAVWFIGKGGVFRLTDGTWSFIPLPSSVGEATVVTGDTTPAGTRSLWLGTSGYGVCRIDLGGWRAEPLFGAPNNSVYSFLELSRDPDRMLVGTSRHLCLLADGRFTESRTLYNRVSALHRLSSSGEVFATTSAPFLRGTGLDLKPAKFPPPGFCLTETVDPTDGTILWIGTSAGLFLLKGTEWTHFKAEDGVLPHKDITSLTETREPDGSRTMWIGTREGLAAWTVRDGRWSTLRGKPADNPNLTVRTHFGPIGNNIKAVEICRGPDGARQLWVGTTNGVSWTVLRSGTDLGRWQSLSESATPPLPNNTVYQVKQDRRGRIYLFTNKGIARLTPRAATDGDPAPFSLHTFTTDDGLPSNECNTGAAYVDGRGRVWVGTIAGAAVFDPAEEIDDRAPKPLHVERAVFFRQTGQGEKPDAGARLATLAFEAGDRPTDAGIDLEYDRNNAAFDYALLSFSREDATRYRTQLVGLEPEPTAWTTERRRNFTTLPHGDYVFRVWGRDGAGNISGPRDIRFHIAPAPWQRWWAYGLYVLGIGGMGYGAYRARVRRLYARQQQLSALVDERTRNLAVEKDRTEQALDQIRALYAQLEIANAALVDANVQERERALRAIATAQQSQLQMLRYQINPHFLFNVLNSIRALIDDEPDRATRMVTELASFLRYSLSTSNVTTVTLGEEIDAIRNFLTIQKIRFEEDLETDITVSPEAARRQVPTFLIQPLVENAIKYGMQTSPMPLKVRLVARVVRDRLIVRVVNTGDWVEPVGHRSESTGIGVENIRKRLGETMGDAADLRFFRRNGTVTARIVIRTS